MAPGFGLTVSSSCPSGIPSPSVSGFKGSVPLALSTASDTPSPSLSLLTSLSSTS